MKLALERLRLPGAGSRFCRNNGGSARLMKRDVRSSSKKCFSSCSPETFGLVDDSPAGLNSHPHFAHDRFN